MSSNALEDVRAEAADFGLRASIEYPGYVGIVDTCGRYIVLGHNGDEWRAEVWPSFASWQAGHSPVESDAVQGSNGITRLNHVLCIANRVAL